MKKIILVILALSFYTLACGDNDNNNDNNDDDNNNERDPRFDQETEYGPYDDRGLIDVEEGEVKVFKNDFDEFDPRFAYFSIEDTNEGENLIFLISERDFECDFTNLEPENTLLQIFIQAPVESGVFYRENQARLNSDLRLNQGEIHFTDGFAVIDQLSEENDYVELLIAIKNESAQSLEIGLGARYCEIIRD